MIFFRQLKERVKLLEYENDILRSQVKEISEHINYKLKPQFPNGRVMREDGWDLSYDTLKNKYRV